jgi:hypothetical protein
LHKPGNHLANINIANLLTSFPPLRQFRHHRIKPQVPNVLALGVFHPPFVSIYQVNKYFIYYLYDEIRFSPVTATFGSHQLSDDYFIPLNHSILPSTKRNPVASLDIVNLAKQMEEL